MITFKCKMCGGDLAFEPGASVAECPYCGTNQTLPKLDDDKRANLYDRANHFRRQNEFDKAMGIYEQILAEDRTDAEAYWSLVLCRYGIEYVEDPASHKRVPTVNRVQFTSILADEDYKSALAYADMPQRSVYEAEANAIAEIQKGILDISRKEEPFDVFICYKDVDANGRRTPDSVLANDMYHQLTKEGFKVFFSRITMEDKIGTAYEPYIFAALNSAKVMVVLGTKPEYFNAVWVKNEWSRYLALIRNGADKILVPAYRDMDPYDLPEEFAHLQAQDMGRLGFMQDLIRGIEKIIGRSENNPQVGSQQMASGNESIDNLMRRARLFLEDGDWASATEYLDRVLDEDAEYAPAYVGKVLVALQLHKEEDLASCPVFFEKSPNWQKAIRFSSDEERKTYTALLDQAGEYRENQRKGGIYQEAKRKLLNATTPKECAEACDIFASIIGYQDAEEQQKACIEKKNKIQYDAAVLMLVSASTVSECMAAKNAFLAIRTYSDAENRIHACDAKIDSILSCAYNSALDLMKAQKWEEAISAFQKLNGYQNSNIRIQECTAALAEEREKADKRREQELEKERERVEQERVEAERKADEVKKKERKRKNLIIMACGTVVAIILLVLVYRNIIKPSSIYNSGLRAMEAGNYDLAIETFLSLGLFKDSPTQLQESRYRKAANLSTEQKYDEAYTIYASLEGYKDVDDIIISNPGIHEAYLASFEVGKTVIFGKYEQNSNKNDGMEPIAWRILKNDGKYVTLISEYGLDWRPFSYNAKNTSWENCSLRSWLNGDFYNTAFDDRAKSRMVAQLDTNDWVYLLSLDEAERLFSSKDEREMECTPYVLERIGKGTSTQSKYDCQYWWLRTLHYSDYWESYFAAQVSPNGYIEEGGEKASSSFSCVVRPVVVLSL